MKLWEALVAVLYSQLEEFAKTGNCLGSMVKCSCCPVPKHNDGICPHELDERVKILNKEVDV